MTSAGRAGPVLITGAAGSIGKVLAEGLPALGHRLRLLDRAAVAGEDTVVADILDPAALDAAMAGVGAVVHLAAISSEAEFADILRANIEGTYHVFDAARRAAVPRMVYASSNHAVGFTPRQGLAGVDLPPRPDTYYGLSKVFGEALGRLYADRYGMAVASLRIGSFGPQPRTPRELSTWLSHGDAVRLVHAGLSAPDLTYAVVYGISANTRGWWDHEPGRTLGYHPADDAESFARQIVAAHGEPDPAERDNAFLGGEFTGRRYDAGR